MAGNKTGGIKASLKIKARYGEDFYKLMGARGGRNGNTGGFTDRELAVRAGRIGGKISRRGKAKSN